jgi:hypothetical protein
VRYTRINIEADHPDDVYPSDDEMAPANNTRFLVDCARKIPHINFVERATGLIYARMESGRMQWVDPDLLQRVMADPEAEVALLAMSPGLPLELDQLDHQSARPVPDEARRHTLGARK